MEAMKEIRCSERRDGVNIHGQNQGPTEKDGRKLR